MKVGLSPKNVKCTVKVGLLGLTKWPPCLDYAMLPRLLGILADLTYLFLFYYCVLLFLHYYGFILLFIFILLEHIGHVG